MQPRLLALWAAAALVSSHAQSADLTHFVPDQPVIPDHTFNLKDFGAVGDGVTSASAAFAQAIAAVHAAGGGKLVVPAGVYLTGPIDLCSGINLHLEADATILFSA